MTDGDLSEDTHLLLIRRSNQALRRASSPILRTEPIVSERLPDILVYNQDGGVCTAHAVSGVVRYALNGIRNRSPPNPSRHQILSTILTQFGSTSPISFFKQKAAYEL